MEHTYLVCYDICDQRRWRKIYKAMKSFGEWLQLSVFQCRLSKENALRMNDHLTDLVDQAEDHVIIIDLGPSESVSIKVESIGKRFEPIERRPVII